MVVLVKQLNMSGILTPGLLLQKLVFVTLNLKRARRLMYPVDCGMLNCGAICLILDCEQKLFIRLLTLALETVVKHDFFHNLMFF